MSQPTSDTLVLDFPAAHRLVDVMAAAATDLHHDRLTLEPMLDEASSLLGRDQLGSLRSLESAERRLDGLAAELRQRLALIATTRDETGRVDALTASIGGWAGPPMDPARAALVTRRSALIRRLVGGSDSLTSRVELEISRGLSIGDALVAVNEAVEREERIEAVAAELDIDLEGAALAITRIDESLAVLDRIGYTDEAARSAVALVERFGLDLRVALTRSGETGVALLDAIGEMLTAGALGLTLAEFDALGGLERYFTVFDDATGGRSDDRVSVGDLEFVVGHRERFTAGQVLAAQALLAKPALRARLDTADENTEILGGVRFGRTEPGDGLIAQSDLRAFLQKAQLHHLLGAYADEIDVAGDPSGVVDGTLSQHDFERFIADNADLPESVRAAARTMIDNGWFDESWWQGHKDELAMGAALLAGGIVVIATAGGASLVLVAGAGALAAGGTTIAVNLATDEDLLDDVFANSFAGLFVGAGVQAAAAGVSAYGTAATALARSAAVASAAGGATEVISLGGLDLLIREEHEATVRDVAVAASAAAGGLETAASSGMWIASRMARFETLEEQLEALSARISRQKQGRHVEGARERVDEIGGFFHDPADAQVVLDAVHDGSADILGRTVHGDILVRVDGVEGINKNLRHAYPDQATNVFVVKGTSSPSVVPASPRARPATPAGSLE